MYYSAQTKLGFALFIQNLYCLPCYLFKTSIVFALVVHLCMRQRAVLRMLAGTAVMRSRVKPIFHQANFFADRSHFQDLFFGSLRANKFA